MSASNHSPRIAEISQLTAARIAGIAYLVIILISLLNVTFVDSRLIVAGNDAATVSNIIANDSLFRLGIAGVLILYASVVVLSWALYLVLNPVNKSLALLAMLLRLGEAILGGATVLISFVVVHLLNEPGLAETLETEQLQALAGLFLNVRTAGLDIVLLFVGLGGTVYCYLFFVSNYVPRILAGWGMFTYLSMLVLSLVSILLPDHPGVIETILYVPGSLFELSFGLWLLFKGVRLTSLQS